VAPISIRPPSKVAGIFRAGQANIFEINFLVYTIDLWEAPTPKNPPRPLSFK